MKTAKTAITKLKTSIENNFTDGVDLYGFSGIDKKLLIDCLTESYALLSELENHKETFDVIYMKRKLTIYINQINDYFKDKFREVSDIGSKFNDFLNVLFKIRVLIKETYLLVVQGSLRKEADLINIDEQITELNSELGEYVELKKSVIESKNTVNEIADDLVSFHNRYESNYEHVIDVVNEVDSAHQHITSLSKSSSDHLEEIQTTKRQILRNKEAYTASVERFEELVVNIKQNNEDSESLLSDISDIKTDIITQQKNIQDIIDDANRASMAGSFKTRKEELNNPIDNSNLYMTGALILTSIVSGLLFMMSFDDSKFDIISFLVKLPIIAPLIWIAWSNSQRNIYLVRIREDYAFKYASAMAFEGYKKQVQLTDPDLEKRLLELSIENMGMNPIRLFDKKVHCSPINDITSTASNLINTVTKSKE